MNMNILNIEILNLRLKFTNEYENIFNAFDDNSYASQIQNIDKFIEEHNKDFMNKKISEEEWKVQVNKQIDKIFEVFAIKLVEHFEVNLTKFDEHAYHFLDKMEIVKNEYKQGKYGLIEAYENCSNLGLNFQLELELKENLKKEKKTKI